MKAWKLERIKAASCSPAMPLRMPHFVEMATVLPEPTKKNKSKTNKRSKKEIEHSCGGI